MPEFVPLDIEGVIEIRPDRFGDDRGFFSETYKRDTYAENGIDAVFVQDNHSLSRQRGVLRGLHYQLPPFAQAKLVRVTRGRVFDVAVDIRKGSPSFGKWVGLELSAEKWNQLFIPAGFAHGFVTLEADTEFLYKVDATYSPQHDRSIRYDDPDIAIEWPVFIQDIIVSAKDEKAPFLAATDTAFIY